MPEIRIFKPEEMGQVVGYHQISLSHLFLRRTLGVHIARLLLNPEKILQETSIICPFCQIGFLELRSIIKHAGNHEYRYFCSHPPCDSKFIGVLNFTHFVVS